MWSCIVVGVFSIAILLGEVRLGSGTRTYCVRPEQTAYQDCPDPCRTAETCHALMYYVKNDIFTTNDATFLFLPGEHHLHAETNITNVSNLTFQGKDNGHANISCHGSDNAGFYFENVTNLTIKKLQVTECSSCYKHDPLLCDAIGMYRITNLSMSAVVISNTTGIGLKLKKLYGNSIISDTIVKNSTGAYGQNLALYCFNDTLYDNRSISNVLIYSSTFQYGHRSIPNNSNTFSHPYASGVFIHIACDIRMNIMLKGSNVTNNTADSYSSGGNIAIEYVSYSQKWLVRISIIDCFIAYGSGNIGGGLYFNTFRIPGGHYDDAKLGKVITTNVTDDITVSILTVNGTCFLENESIYGAGVYMRFRETEWPMVARVSFNNCQFKNQKIKESEQPQHGGVAIHIRNFQLPVYVPHKRPLLVIEFSNCNFTENIPKPNASFTSLYAAESHNGVLFIQGIDSATLSGCTFANNNCSGIVSIQSLLIMRGMNIIHNNTGIRGGGMVLCSRSIIFLHNDSFLNITNNRAMEFGGGIYVESECDQDIPHCFFQVNSSLKTFNHTRVSLVNNSALAGEAIYGGMVDHCIIYMNITQNYTDDEASKIFNETFHIVSTGNSAISSNPSSVCFCSNETYDETTCLKNQTMNMTTVVPGSTIHVYIMLLGQRQSPAPGIVEAMISCERGKCSTNNEFKDTVQNTTQCTKLDYVVHSSHENQSGMLEFGVVRGTFEYSGSLNQFATVDIFIWKCPLGSIINHSKGACSSLLNLPGSPTYITNWIESKGNPPVWIGYKTPMTPLPNTTQIIYHEFCPLDYCMEGHHGITIKTTYKSFDQDVQCAKHRTGLLCGKCKQSYSLGFGSSQCLACCNTAHRYLQYLRVIGLVAVCAVAGILLVVLLTLLNLTVAEGTLNGLIFYANIVQVNLDLFFPSDTHARPWTAFIAWLNLDFGVTVCFYDGMDAYVKTWLQFIFPLYIWIISGGIVYFSRKSIRIAKLAGKNSVKVLATLFLLSFGKLISTAIAAGSFTNVKSYDGTIYISVWLLDANVHYLHGKHIMLFIIACLAGILALLYALILTFIQCLRRAPNSRMCGWVQRLKPLLDAYTGPYKNKYHFWTGFLLLVRIALFISFAVNFNDNPTMNFTLIITVCTFLLIFVAVIQPGIYRNRLVGYLEGLMYLNLIFFSGTMMFTLGKNTQFRAIAAYFFGGLALVKFLGIITYHAYKEWIGPLKNCKWFLKNIPAGNHGGLLVESVLIQNRDSEDSSEEEEEDNNERGVSIGRCLPPN